MTDEFSTEQVETPRAEQGEPADRSYAQTPGKVALLLFIALFVTFAYFFHAEPGWNVNSRICLTYALVEQRSFTIDAYQEIEALETEDRALYEGHYYSDKIIGTSLLGAVPMTALHVVSRVLEHEFSWDTKRYVVRTFSVSLLGALAGVVLCALFLQIGLTASGSLFLALAFFFATQMFSVCTVFLSYAPAICFTLISYFLLLTRRDALEPKILFLAGLALGGALLCEYTLGLVAVGLSAYTIFHIKRKYGIVWYWLGAVLPLTLFAAYTMICFGRPTIPYEYLERQEFKEGMSRGFQGIVGFNPTVLYYITIHRYRGLFYHSPFLLLAVWGWVGMLRGRRWRSDAVLSISMVVAYLAFNASYYMWWGGWTNGPRHLIPALPFLIIPLAWVWRSGAAGRLLLAVFAMVGVFFNTLPAMVDAQIPQGYQAAHLFHPRVMYNYRDPLWEIGIKGFWEGRLARNAGHLAGLRGLWSLVPLAVFWCLAALATVRVLRRDRAWRLAPPGKG